MSKTFKLIALCAFLASFAFGQALVLNPSSLSSPLTTSSGKVLVVASVGTGSNVIASPTVSTSTNLYIDQELMAVQAVNSTTITVQRGIGGTSAAPHASGALVFYGPPSAFFSNPRLPNPQGSCTRSNLQVTPYINVATGIISDCLGGTWVHGVTTANPEYRLMFPAPGATAYTSINTNGTAVGATTLYCMEANLPYNKLLTGIAVLNGTTVTGNARYVVLYDSAGNALANSALAGQASVTASIYEAYDFTSTFYAVGPSKYFACIQDNAVGSTTVRMAVTGVNDNFLTKGQTSATFGTVPTLTVPTSFTTAVGPYVYLY